MNSSYRVGLVQINNSYSGHAYFPYAIGLLQAYVQTHAEQPERYTFLEPIFQRIGVEAAVEQLQTADIVGFSVYVWNIQLSLAVAKALKALNPEVFIVFGGPQVPDHAADFLAQAPFIDACIHGEGEPAFLHLLESWSMGQDWRATPSLSYREGERYRINPRMPRTPDLAQLPSPYLTGVFDELVERYPELKWLALWESNRGCPFSCSFCDWGSATAAKVYRFDEARLYAEVDWFAAHQIEFIFCCDANFGMLKRDLELARYVAQSKAQKGYPQILAVQNTKNATDRAYQVQLTLAAAGLNKGVTLALQSMSEHTLQQIQRSNISTEFFQELQQRFTRDNIETYTDIILGLPGESYESFVAGVNQVIEKGQHNRIQFMNLAILPNAEMGSSEYQARHGLQLVTTPLMNGHGAPPRPGDVIETQELVVATATMPPAQWRKTRIFSSTTSLLYFNKILQLPLVLLWHLGVGSPADLLQHFVDPVRLKDYPTLSAMYALFKDYAEKLQAGGPEYLFHPDWLDVAWPVDEYALIQLAVEKQLEPFYAEAERLLLTLLEDAEHQSLVSESVLLNRSLLKRPFVSDSLQIELQYNLWDVYQAVLRGERVELQRGEFHYLIDRSSETWDSWDDWFREVVWYGNKRGAYLYHHEKVQLQLAGHH